MNQRYKYRKNAEELRRLLELRRSNASQPMPNKKRYKRKLKHADRSID
jgi:hypothetical protein